MKSTRTDAVCIGTDTLHIWMHLRDEGGWWDAGEIARALWPELPNKRALGKVFGACHALVRGGHVAEQRAMVRVRYGVTRACYPVPGHSIEPAA